MNRREALSATALLFGGTIIGGQAFLLGCQSKNARELTSLGTEELSLLDEIGETIIPATEDSPGAKAAKVGEFMKTMVADCYTEEDQNAFLNGIRKFRQTCDDKYGKEFIDLSSDEKRQLLLNLEKEAANDKKHYYIMIKQLTVLGFLTSEPGATKAMRHVAVPGRFDACIPYKKGEKAWV